jgi:hypothetical protein
VFATFAHTSCERSVTALFHRVSHRRISTVATSIIRLVSGACINWHRLCDVGVGRRFPGAMTTAPRVGGIQQVKRCGESLMIQGAPLTRAQGEGGLAWTISCWRYPWADRQRSRSTPLRGRPAHPETPCHHSAGVRPGVGRDGILTGGQGDRI